MDYKARHQAWLAGLSDPELLAELAAVTSDDSELHERFYKELDFGTAGLRGLIGAGSNRMNIITVGRAAAGLAAHVKATGGANRGVIIARDSRHKSDLFARRVASVIAAAGVRVYIFSEIAATPLLSYGVRALGCAAGVVVTASHNPAPYNGFKVYGSDGGQLDTADSAALYGLMQHIDPFGVPALDFDAGLTSGEILAVPARITEDYLTRCKDLLTQPEVIPASGLRVVYTPLNGAGQAPVERLLSEVGLEALHVVPEQREPDGDFPTAPYPNPEDPAALALALRLAGETGADLVVATDPDADRLSVAVLISE